MEQTFFGKFSTEHMIANGIIPAADMKITNDIPTTGNQANEDRSYPLI